MKVFETGAPRHNAESPPPGTPQRAAYRPELEFKNPEPSPAGEGVPNRSRTTTAECRGHGRDVHLRPRDPSATDLEQTRRLVAKAQGAIPKSKECDCCNSPTLRRAWPRDGPEAAICVQDVDVQCVLQFTLIHAASCALHRRTSRVIHRSKLFSTFYLKKPFQPPPKRR